METKRSSLRPASIAVHHKKKHVCIDWNDGSKSIFSFEQLRAACPCAECRALQKKDDPLQRALIVSTGLESAQLVGNYALQFIWDDGHRFGIYTWEYLSSLR